MSLNTTACPALLSSCGGWSQGANTGPAVALSDHFASVGNMIIFPIILLTCPLPRAFRRPASRRVGGFLI